MGRRHESRRHYDRDEVNIDIGRYPGRSSSRRHAYPSESVYDDTTSPKGPGAKVSLRWWAGIIRFLQFVFTAAAAGIMGRCIFRPPNPAYPPNSTGDGGAVPFLFTVGVLGVITAVIGGLSACNCFNRLANRGSKRRFFRYTSPCADAIFVMLAGGALALAIIKLRAGATDCVANMGTYQGCVMLMVAIVMVCLGGVMAGTCFVMEVCCMKRKKETSWSG